VNPLVAIGFWSGMFWREQVQAFALLYRSAKAKREGDQITNRKYRKLAQAAEGRLLALTSALEAFCRRHNIDLAQALGATVTTSVDGVDRFMPGLDVPVDLNYQHRIELVLAELSAPRPCHPRERN
jgi:hypothetical protein